MMTSADSDSLGNSGFNMNVASNHKVNNSSNAVSNSYVMNTSDYGGADTITGQSQLPQS